MYPVLGDEDEVLVELGAVFLTTDAISSANLVG